MYFKLIYIFEDLYYFSSTKLCWIKTILKNKQCSRPIFYFHPDIFRNELWFILLFFIFPWNQLKNFAFLKVFNINNLLILFHNYYLKEIHLYYWSLLQLVPHQSQLSLQKTSSVNVFLLSNSTCFINMFIIIELICCRFLRVVSFIIIFYSFKLLDINWIHQQMDNTMI